MSTLADSSATYDFNDDTADDQSVGATGPNFVENGSISYTSGTPGRAVVVPAGSANSLTIANASASAWQPGSGSITIFFRAKATSFPVAFNSLLSFGATSSSEAGLALFHKSDGTFLGRVADGTTLVQRGTTSTAASGTEYTVALVYDRTEELLAVYLNDEDPITTNTGTLGTVTSSEDVSIGTDFQNNGAFEISFIDVYQGVRTHAEILQLRNDSEGITVESELARDGWDPATNCNRVRIQAKAAQIGGTGTQTAMWLVVSEGALPDEMLDSDLATALSSGATLRASLDSAGTKQIPIHALVTTPNSTPASAKFEFHLLPQSFHTGDSTLDGTSGTDIYLWWGLSGATLSPASGPYGQYAVYGEEVVYSGVYGSTTDYSREGQTVTEAGTIASVAGPYGADGYEFDGTDDRLTVADSSSLGYADEPLVIENLIYLDSLTTSGYETFWAKRLGLNAANYGAGRNSNESGNDYVYGYFVDSTFERNNIDQSDNFTATTWHHMAVEFEPSGSDTIIRFYVDGSLVQSVTSSSKSVQDNNRDLVVGAYQSSVGVFSEFFDGRMKGLVIRDGTYTADQHATVANNRLDPATFWDHSFAVDSPGGGVTVSGSVTDGAETLSGSISVIVDVTGALTDGGESLSGSVSVVVDVSGGLTDAGETLSGVLSTSQAFSGSLTDSPETLSGVVSVVVDALGALADGGEVLSGSVSVTVTASGGLTDGGEVLSGALSDPNLVIVAKNPFVVPFEDRIFKVYA